LDFRFWILDFGFGILGATPALATSGFLPVPAWGRISQISNQMPPLLLREKRGQEKLLKANFHPVLVQ
jgi:hypothetical protein